MELGLSIVLQLTLFLFYTADGFSISFATPSLRSRIRLITSTDLKRHTISNDYFKAASDEILHALNAKDPNAPLLITMHDTAVARKAGSIVSLDISSLTDIAVFMVIIKSNNRLHNRAIAYHIDQELSKQHGRRAHVEGRSSGWVAMDTGGILAHVMTPEQYDYYDLRGRWVDAKEIDISKLSKSIK